MGVELAAMSGLVSAGMSFSQASKARKEREQAQNLADEAFAEAREQLEVNYLEELSISKEPYERQREALAQQAAQAIEVGREGDPRLAAATAGRVLGQAQKAEQAITTQQTQDIESLKKAVADEEKALASKRAELDLAQAEGAGIAAAEAANLEATSMQSATQGLVDTGMGLYEMSELYPQQKLAGVTGTNQGRVKGAQGKIR